jgi:hypothetical protein
VVIKADKIRWESFASVQHPFSTLSSSGDTMLLSPFLTVSALVGVALATTNDDYCAACKVVETAISNASKVYYPGKSEQLLRW